MNYLQALSDTRKAEFFTRDYDQKAHWPFGDKPSTAFVVPDLEFEDEAKHFRHDFPVKNEASNNLLLEGADETETKRLNIRASIKLSDIRSWVQASQTSPYSRGHNESGADSADNEFSFGTGYGVDIRHDNGPSVFKYDKKTKTYRSRLKELYEAGSKTKAVLGKPWHAGPVTLANDETDSGERIKYLYQAGRVRFDFSEFGKMKTHGKNKIWQDYETVVRAPRGQKDEPVAIAGTVNASSSKIDSMSDTSSTNRSVASSYDAATVWAADNNERDRANSELDNIATVLTPRMYDALIAAASGETYDAIGRLFMPGLKKSDRRPTVKGKAIVVDALEILLLRDFRDLS
ncbi:hypothetical protein FNL55_13450 [Tardiphaga sp. vice352]|uniref:hypothetical protein n=1 Tax=Tardiphaga sp. vice352 TaxID=2592816 RepID=UPI001162DA8B|nr:hypothetical protein [Tardiphaga sp. vice352]QDM32234.1 hypothetical protein FNL55_13450 [Tardiphaga sp. vice352]